jgi:cellulose synthase/poly-beta-1,6-N-acetylglucosamine synthase-like glycosyltransferase
LEDGRDVVVAATTTTTTTTAAATGSSKKRTPSSRSDRHSSHSSAYESASSSRSRRSSGSADARATAAATARNNDALRGLASQHVAINISGDEGSDLSNTSSEDSNVQVILLSNTRDTDNTKSRRSRTHGRSPSRTSHSGRSSSKASSIRSLSTKSSSRNSSPSRSSRKSGSRSSHKHRATSSSPQRTSSKRSLELIQLIQEAPYVMQEEKLRTTITDIEDADEQPGVRRTKSIDLKTILQPYRTVNSSSPNASPTGSQGSKDAPKRQLKRTTSLEVKELKNLKTTTATTNTAMIAGKPHSPDDSNESPSDDSILGRYVDGMATGFSRSSYSRQSSSPSKSTSESDTSISSDDESLNVIPVAVATEEGPTRAEKWQKFLHDVDDYIRRKLQYGYMLFTLYAVPVLVAYFAPKYYVSVVYFFSLGCIAFVNGWMLTEGVSAFYYTKKQRDLHHSSPEIIGEKRLGAIISAYLPNELTVLIDTVRAVIKQIETLPETATLDVVVSHNGGSRDQRLQFLAALRKIEKEIPERVLVHEMNVVSSKSKAENVNGGLCFFELLTVKRGMIFTELAMYDADHQPIPEAFLFALETMQDQKADMVMGRCCVQSGFKFIAVEFDILYSVAHAGGRMVRGFGFFGGSNGYWDYVTLQETGMDEGMLTEDVDSSFRAQAAGHRMTYDPTIVSFEEAPPSLLALFKQRLRWSQGWGEVTVRQKTLWFRPAPGLTLWSRFCIFLLLPFRELYAYFSSFTVPIAIVWLTRACGVACIDYRLIGFLIFCAQVPIFMTWAAWYLTKDRVTGIHYRMPTMIRKDYYIYIIMSYAYEFAKVHSSVLGHARNFLGLNAWVVTKRKSVSSEGNEDEEDDASVIEEVDRPEELVENSPYAPPVRRLFAGIFDAREYQPPGPPGHALEGWPGKEMERTDSYDTDDESTSSASSFSIERVAI